MSEKADTSILSMPGAEIYAWVGFCLSQWAYIEDAIFTVCDWSLQSDLQVTIAVFHGPPTLETKLSHVTTLLRGRLYPDGRPSGTHDPKLLKDWDALAAEIRDLMPTRNAIAHDRVKGETLIIGHKGPDGKWVAEKARTVTAHYVTQSDIGYRHRQRTNTDLSINDLLNHWENVEALLRRLWVFVKPLQKQILERRPPVPSQKFHPSRKYRPPIGR